LSTLSTTTSDRRTTTKIITPHKGVLLFTIDYFKINYYDYYKLLLAKYKTPLFKYLFNINYKHLFIF
jgi:hypothetical protein